MRKFGCLLMESVACGGRPIPEAFSVSLVWPMGTKKPRLLAGLLARPVCAGKSSSVLFYPCIDCILIDCGS